MKPKLSNAYNIWTMKLKSLTTLESIKHIAELLLTSLFPASGNKVIKHRTMKLDQNVRERQISETFRDTPMEEHKD